MAEGQQGVMLVGAEIKGWPGWSFRNQPDDDFGVDCQAEPPGIDYASGRLIGLQVKTGRAKYFRRPAQDGSGWYYSPDTTPGKPDKHLRYWLEHDLPVAVVLVDEVAREMYWQHVTLDRVIFTGSSWKILVPASQRLDACTTAAFFDLVARPHVADQDVLATATAHLPPSARRILRSLQTVDHFKALQLAVTLSRGRQDAARTVTMLLSAGRKYLRGKGDGRLSAAVGAYASEHVCHALAAQAFADAAAQASEPARYLTLTALAHCSAGAREEARRTLAAAQDAGASALLCSWITLFIDHHGFGHPKVPAQLLQDSALAAAVEPVFRSYLGDAALASGDLDTAVAHFEAALADQPDSSGLQIAMANVLLSRAAGERSLRPTADLDRAIELCTAARAQRLKWNGPSDEPLAILVRACMLAGDFNEAVRLATPRPDGEMTTQEAASGLVPYLGIKAALDLGDRAAAERIAGGFTADSPYTCATRLSLTAGGLATAAQGEWERIVDTAQDLDVLVSAIHRIADCGQWPIPKLDELLSSGVIAAEGYEIIRARSEAARGELASARRRLRSLPSALAVYAHVELLEAAGQTEEALAVCTRGLTQFKTGDLARKQWNLLVSLDRAQEAERRAVDLLGRSLPPLVRAMLRAFVVGAAMQRHEWLTVEEHCHAALLEDPAQTKFHWALIGAAYNQRQWTSAWTRLVDMQPQILTPDQASLWLALHSHFGFSEDEANAALGFIDRWPESYELHRQVILSLSTRGNKVNAEGRPILPADSDTLRDRFQLAVQQFLAQGEEGLHALTGSLQELLDSAKARLLGQAPVDLLVHEMVRQSVVPLASVCAVQRRSYARSLIERSFGPIIAVTTDPEEFDREVLAAASALDNAVVIDISALVVVAELPARWPLLRGVFTQSHVDDDSRFDCLVTCADVRQAPDTVASLSIDTYRGELRFTQPSEEELATLAARANQLEGYLGGLDTHDHASGSAPVIDGQPWERVIRIALSQRATLWCDDVALRAHARTLGCPVFGTLALLQAMADCGQLDGDPRQDVLQLARAEIVDLYLEPGELAQLAADLKGYPGPAAAALQRPAYWRYYATAVGHFLDTLDRLEDPPAEAVAMWAAAACGGICSHVSSQQLGSTLRTFATTVADHLADRDDYRALLLEVADHVAAVEQSRREAIAAGQATLFASDPGDARTPEADGAGGAADTA